MGLLRAHLNVVLHQIRSPENLGAVARLMANFDLERLILSDPMTFAIRKAERVAVRGSAVLEGLRLERSLEAALADSVFVVGTTGRATVKNRRTLSPEDAVARLAEESARGRVALLFGGEQRGLSDEELERCHEILVIPTSDKQPSMNLAQSAAVLLYLCARADGAAPSPPAPEPGARMQTLHALEGRMRDVLLRADFLNPQAPDHILHELGRSLVRGHLTQREAELWLNAFAHLDRVVKPAGPKS
ncbi:MAG: RNA methyltransferase [Myxococcaceae bacterium]|nr:RNA methyltransferase [Myxococcaceae bacterium]